MPRESLRSQIKFRISQSQEFVFMPGDFLTFPTEIKWAGRSGSLQGNSSL